jgi:D-inositol-3-phosphate glycosyltransferase
VVPALAGGGGVPAVADFLCTQIERTGRFRLKVFSLATSSRDDCSLRLLAPRTWRGSRAATGEWNGREFTHFGANGAEFEFRRIRSTRLLRRALAQCDLIQVVAGSPALAMAVMGCNKPVVLQAATRIVMERRRALREGGAAMRGWRRLMTAIMDRYDDRALRMVDAVMVENRWMLEYARRIVRGGQTNVVLAPPGIDCEALSPSATREARVRDNPYILFVGRLADPRKNLPLLCRTYALLCAESQRPPELVLAGQGDLPEAAKSALSSVGSAGRVRLAGAPSRTDLIRLYQDAACLALPSDEEGFGMVVVEAMACGVPVVATRCGGPEEIISEGQDGFLVALDDAREFAHRLRALCADWDLNARLGAAARRTVESRYAAQMAFRPFLRAYDRLL